MNKAIKMMIGMGMPKNKSKSERMEGLLETEIEFSSDLAAKGAGHRSRCRPPKVAPQLAKNAPISNDTNNHSAP